MNRIVLTSAFILLWIGTDARAQPGQFCLDEPIDYCSIPTGWGHVKQGLDALALGACLNHDVCYRGCNHPNGPYKTYSYKYSCDGIFYAELLSACNIWSLVLGFPNVEWVDREDFLEDCGAFATTAAAIVTAIHEPFEGRQLKRCNRYITEALFGQGAPMDLQSCEECCGYDVFDNCSAQPWLPECGPICPILIDLNGNGLKLTGPNPATYFDIDADGDLERTSWTRNQTKDAFLALDRNGNGLIDDGRELFGDSAPLLLGPGVPEHGYEVLAEFDEPDLGGNADGVISHLDAIYDALVLWFDTDRSGTSEPSELVSLTDAQVLEIGLDFHADGRLDQWGNEFRWSGKVLVEGRLVDSIDVFFVEHE